MRERLVSLMLLPSSRGSDASTDFGSSSRFLAFVSITSETFFTDNLAGFSSLAVPNSETNITKNFDEATNSMDLSELDASVSSSATDSGVTEYYGSKSDNSIANSGNFP